jgi:hypothetical protein
MYIKNRKKITLLLFFSLLFLVLGFFETNPATAGDGVILPTNTGLSPASIVGILTGLLKWMLQILGILALISFVISGVVYLVSTGNEEMINKAKKAMTYSIVGITVALASFVVVKTIDLILKASAN